MGETLRVVARAVRCLARDPALALALLVIVFTVANGSDGTPPIEPVGDGARATVVDADAARRAAPIEHPDAAPDTGDPTEAEATRTAVDLESATLATIRGRCVDEGGEPLSGVAVDLHGWGGNSARMTRYKLDRGDVEWTDPEDLVTGLDGRFEHRFEPPPPYQFTCEANAAGYVSVYARWGEIEPGATIDMEDVVLRRGVEVTGRLVDESGVGIAKQSIRLRRSDRDWSALRGRQKPRDSGHASTDAGGFFTLHRPLPAGDYSIELWKLVVKEPTDAVELALPRADLRIVASTPPPDDRPTIEGVVVDARGQPVRGAQILAGVSSFFSPTTGRDGTFVLKQGDRIPPTPVALGVDAAGYVPWRSDEAITWGTRDLRITLVEGPTVTIRVRRADDDTPIERFGIVLAPISPNGRWSSRDGRLQHLGDHPGGVLEIPRATTGRFWLSVVPTESAGLTASSHQEVDIELGVPKQLEVRIALTAERIVEVVTTHGDPVPGARVELLWHRGGGEITLGMTAMRIKNARINSPNSVAVLVDEVTTDADGRATLHGRSDGALGLRLPGPGHVPVLVTPFRMSDEGPARVVVGVGGALVGRVEPVEILASLRVEAGLPAEGPVDARLQDYLPGILLARAGSDMRETFPGGRVSEGLPLGVDGRFEIAGIPPGIWDVHVRLFVVRTHDGGSISGSRRTRVAASGVVIVEGEERELVLDLASWRRHPVSIRARLDGEPFHGMVTLRGTLSTANGGADEQERRNLEIDGEDELVTALPAGSWTTSIQVHVDDGYAPLPGPTFVIGANANGPTRVDIDLRLGRCTVVVLDPDGQPARDVVLHAVGGSVRYSYASRKTDATGRTVLMGSVGAMRFRTRRWPLAHDQVFRAWMREQSRDPTARDRAWIDLGALDLVPGALAEPRTITLPAEWAELPK